MFQDIRVFSGTEGFRRDAFFIENTTGLIALLVGCLVEGKAGTASFDDVQIASGMPADWQSYVAPSTIPSASIQIDANQVVRRLPATLVGQNHEWMYDGNGTWDSSRAAPVPSALTAASEIGGLHRFPGGNLADWYRWQQGVGPVASRPTASPAPGLPMSAHTFGTDEFLQFVQSAGGQPLITVNIYSGTAAEAADWVRHANKTTRRVTFWQIGNEPYVTGKPTSLTPEQYAQKFVEFATAMRAADPGIRLGAVLDENYSRRSGAAWLDWTARVFAIAASQIDFVCVHAAYAPVIGRDLGWNPRTVYSAMLAAPSLFERHMNNLSTRLQALAGRRVPIAVTEWGPLFSDSSQSRFLQHTRTMGSSLYTTSTLAAMARSTGADYSSYFKFADTFEFMGALTWTGSQWTPRGPHLAMRLFAREHGADLIRTQLSSASQFDSPTVGWVDAAGGVPHLDVMATRALDNRSLTLMVVNRHLDSPITANIAVSGFAVASRQSTTLAANGVDSHLGAPISSTIVPQAEVEPLRRWNLSSSTEIRVETGGAQASSTSFSVSFPPYSVTYIKLR